MKTTVRESLSKRQARVGSSGSNAQRQLAKVMAPLASIPNLPTKSSTADITWEIPAVEFERRMKEIVDLAGGDYERVHAAADNLMIEMLRRFGFGKGCDIYETIEHHCA